jgi:hypothetical protein
MGLFNKHSKTRPPKGAIVNTEAYQTDPVYQEHNAGNGSGYVSVIMPSSSEGERAFLTEMLESIGREAYGENLTEVAEIPIVENDIGRFDVRTSDYRILFEKGQGKDFVKALKSGRYAKDIKLVKNSNAMINQWTQVEDWNLNSGFYDPIGSGTPQEFSKTGAGIRKSLTKCKDGYENFKAGVSKIGKGVKNFGAEHKPEICLATAGLFAGTATFLNYAMMNTEFRSDEYNLLYNIFKSSCVLSGSSTILGIGYVAFEDSE